MPAKKDFANWVNGLHKDKFSGFSDGEYPIIVDRREGYRMDHQGLNNDPSTKPHRIYIQPVGGGTSRASKKLSSKAVVAAIHCNDPEDDQLIREALLESFKQNGKTMVV